MHLFQHEKWHSEAVKITKKGWRPWELSMVHVTSPYLQSNMLYLMCTCMRWTGDRSLFAFFFIKDNSWIFCTVSIGWSVGRSVNSFALSKFLWGQKSSLLGFAVLLTDGFLMKERIQLMQYSKLDISHPYSRRGLRLFSSLTSSWHLKSICKTLFIHVATRDAETEAEAVGRISRFHFPGWATS